MSASRPPTWLRYALRIGWVAIQFLLAWWMGQRGSYFFYQGF